MTSVVSQWSNVVDWAGVVISGLALLFTILVTVAGTSWSVSTILEKRDAALVDMLNKHELSDLARFAEVRAQNTEMSEKLTSYIGETGHALREQLHKIELSQQRSVAENLTLFIRRESFYPIIKSLELRFDKVDSRFDRLDEKFDRRSVELDRRGAE